LCRKKFITGKQNAYIFLSFPALQIILRHRKLSRRYPLLGENELYNEDANANAKMNFLI
jgi:hypothetical protein